MPVSYTHLDVYKRQVSILTPEQTQYYFLSGFTAKLAGTERGITDVYKRQDSGLFQSVKPSSIIWSEYSQLRRTTLA